MKNETKKIQTVLTALPICPSCSAVLRRPEEGKWEGLHIERGDKLWCGRTAEHKTQCHRCKTNVLIRGYLSVDYVTGLL